MHCNVPYVATRVNLEGEYKEYQRGCNSKLRYRLLGTLMKYTSNRIKPAQIVKFLYHYSAQVGGFVQAVHQLVSFVLLSGLS